MDYQLFSRVALKVDLPEEGLRQGDVATIVEAHPGNLARNAAIRWKCSTLLERPSRW